MPRGQALSNLPRRQVEVPVLLSTPASHACAQVQVSPRRTVRMRAVYSMCVLAWRGHGHSAQGQPITHTHTLPQAESAGVGQVALSNRQHQVVHPRDMVMAFPSCLHHVNMCDMKSICVHDSHTQCITPPKSLSR